MQVVEVLGYQVCRNASLPEALLNCVEVLGLHPNVDDIRAGVGQSDWGHAGDLLRGHLFAGRSATDHPAAAKPQRDTDACRNPHDWIIGLRT